MKCPDCKGKITEDNWDAEYEWYECPKCEGAFAKDEIKQPGIIGPTRPVAKGKKLQAARAADAELEKEEVERIVKKKTRNSEADVKRHRDELPTAQVVNIMADEIQAVYEAMGGSLDDLNARDKGLTIWRDLMIHGHVSAREQAVPMSLCGEHE